MILYIFGAGHGADEVLEDSLIPDIDRRRPEIVLVEDSPRSKDVMSTNIVPCIGYGLISAWSPVWKAKLDKEFKKFVWVSAVSLDAKILCDMPVGLNARHGVFVSKSVKLGRHVRLNVNTSIHCDCVVGDYCFLAVGSVMTGFSKIGKGSILYSNAVILPNVTVGDNCVIGAGSVVTKDIGDNVIAYGNPCKVVRAND
jgi:hypothetical protein